MGYNALSIRFRLFLLAAILIFGLGFYGIFGFVTTQEIRIKGNYYNQIIQQKDLVADILPPPEYIIETYLSIFQLSLATEKKEIIEGINRVNKLKQEYFDGHASWESRLPPGKLREDLIVNSYEPAREFFDIYTNQFLPALKRGDKGEMDAILNGPLKQKYTEHRSAIDNVVRVSDANAAELEKEGEYLYHRAFMILTVTWSLMIIIGTLLAYLISRSITFGLKSSIQVLEVASSEIKSKIDQQAQTIVEQSSSVNETTAAMDELNASFEHTGALAKDASEKAKNSLHISKEGTTLLSKMLDNLSNHKNNVNAVSEQILRLTELTRQIHNIASVINNLASQTNILALNAAVQAACVKEHGEGFSVVATEIRKLADESKKFLGHIDTLVENISRETDEIIRIGAEGTKTLNDSINLAQVTSEAFNKVIAISNATVESAEQVSANVNQQANGVSQVLEAMELLNEGTKASSKGMLQIKGVLDNLNLTTKQLKDII